MKPINCMTNASNNNGRRSSDRASAGNSSAPTTCPKVISANSDPLACGCQPSCI
ncbi:hypothetical protein D3C76_1664260 [compost metagenome]